MNRKQSYVYNLLEEMFYRHDPIGLAKQGAPPDEYANEAEEVYLCLIQADYDSIEKLKSLLYDIFSRGFDDMAGVPSTYQALAEEIHRTIYAK